MADELAKLILSGTKTATSYAYNPNELIENVGERWIVLYGDGSNCCVVENTEVKIIPFNQVDASFAYDEGEGSRTLEYWREEHMEFFARNGDFSEDMLLVCVKFKVVDKL